MKTDQGVIYVLTEHFLRHLYPRAVEIEKELEAGQRLSDTEIGHVAQVLLDIKRLRPLIERNPEHRELAQAITAMYASIAKRTWQNEFAPNSIATTETALHQ